MSESSSQLTREFGGFHRAVAEIHVYLQVRLRNPCTAKVWSTFQYYSNAASDTFVTNTDTGSESFPSKSQDLESTRMPEPSVQSANMRQAQATIGAAERFLPFSVLRIWASLKAAQKRLLLAERCVDKKKQLNIDLVVQVDAAIAKVQSRLEFNSRYEQPQAIRDELNQRFRDLYHCLSCIGRRSELDNIELQEAKENERLCSQQLANAIEEWLASAAGVPLEAIDVVAPDIRAPFDDEIIRSAETACEKQSVEDEQELERLKAFPLQRRGVVLGRRGIKRETCEVISDNKYELERWQRRHQELIERYDTRQDNEETESRVDDHPEVSDLDQHIREAEDKIDLYEDNLDYAIGIARQLEVEVTDTGTITGDRGYDDIPGSTAFGASGADSLDLKPEEMEKHIPGLRQAVQSEVESWCNEVDSDYVPSDEPLTPITPHAELTEPQPLDSVSNYGENRIDFGYSLYRLQIDEMERLRERARAEMPPEARPLRDDDDDPPRENDEADDVDDEGDQPSKEA